MPKKEILKEFYKRLIKEIRKKKNLTQKQLGEKIGKKEITIRKYESGNLNISDELIYLIIKKTNLLKTQFIDIITSLEVCHGLIGDKEDGLINNDFITEMILDLYSETSGLNLFFVPICPKLENLSLNTEYTEKLNQKCQDEIYLYITQIVRLNNKEEKVKDNLMLELSEKTISYLKFLLKENNITD